MGQEEIIAFLRNERKKGNDNYFTIHEIRKNANGSCHYGNVRKSIYGLVRTGIIEHKTEGDVWEWVRIFRLAEKYIDVE